MGRFRPNRPLWPRPQIDWEPILVPDPERLFFPILPEMRQVEPGRQVRVGQPLGGGFVSPVSGRAEAAGTYLAIGNDGNQTPVPAPAYPTLDGLTPREILDAVTACGAMGPDGLTVVQRLEQLCDLPEALLLAGLEMSQTAEVWYRGEQVLGGTRILMRLLGISQVTLTLPTGLRPLQDKLRRLLPADGSVEALYLPQPFAQLSPRDLKQPNQTLQLSPQEAAAIYDGVYFGKVHRLLPVCLLREGLVQTLRVTVGTPVRAVLQAAGLEEEQLLLGDGLTGVPVDTDTPVVPGKQLYSLPARSTDFHPKACLHCGRCVGVCPARLRPDRLHALGLPKPDSCLDCGRCRYVCPVGCLPAFWEVS